MLNDLKSDYEIIAELSQRLADAQDQCIALRAETSRLYAALSDSRRELEEAAAELDRTKSIMSFYFLAAVFIGVFITVYRQI
jgi:multidrug resistance efflux pump